jgi:hypothetical protein
VAILCRLVGEKIEDVAEHAGIGLVDLGITAPYASDSREATRLNIKNLAPKTTRGPHLARFAFGIRALRTSIVEHLHGQISYERNSNMLS